MKKPTKKEVLKYFNSIIFWNGITIGVALMFMLTMFTFMFFRIFLLILLKH
jgi:hypothetical protein